MSRASVGDYVVTSKLGSGSFAVVYKGHHKTTKTPVAIKALSLSKLSGKLLQNLEMEISIMRQIDDPNVVKLYEIKKTEKHMYLILEYCAGGDLQQYLKKHDRSANSDGGDSASTKMPLPESVAQHFLQELAKGMHCLWKHNLIHRDLKPQNLLLSEDSPTTTLKIADFGFARPLATQSMAETLCGSPLYMAPEILKFQKYDAKADLWSVGAIFYESVVGRTPYTGANHVQLLANIERKELQFPPGVDSLLSEDCKSLLRGLLTRRPSSRMGFEQFFAHPFVNLSGMSQELLTKSTVMTSQPSIQEEAEEDEDPPTNLWASASASSLRSSMRPNHAGSTTNKEVLQQHLFGSVSHAGASVTRSRRNSFNTSSSKSRRNSLTPSPPAGSEKGLSPQMSPHVLPSPRINPFKEESSPRLPPKNSNEKLQVDADPEYVLVGESDKPEENANEPAYQVSQVDMHEQVESRRQLVEIVRLRVQAILPLADALSLPSTRALQYSSSPTSIHKVSTEEESIVSLNSSMSSSLDLTSTSPREDAMDEEDCLSSSVQLQLQTQAAEGLQLYLQCLSLIKRGVHVLQEASNGPSLDASTMVPWSETNRKLSLAYLMETLNTILTKADKCAQTLALYDASQVSPRSVGQLVTNYALQRAKEAAVQEVLGQYQASSERYVQSLLCLEVAMEVDQNKSLSDVVRQIETRVKNVQQYI